MEIGEQDRASIMHKVRKFASKAQHVQDSDCPWMVSLEVECEAGADKEE